MSASTALSQNPRNRVIAQALHVAPGAALAAVVAIASTFISTQHGGPQLLYALFIGMAFHYLSAEPRTAPGIEFCARTVLRVGVALLGARITLEQIAALGWSTAALVATGTFTTVILGLLLARVFGLHRHQGVLLGGAVGICGASAALAISSVLPRDKDGDRFTLLVVVTVTVLSTVAMVLYPLLATALDLSPQLAGVFLGGTIHDVAQVAGAGYMLGEVAGDTAILVKLFRVSLLVVVVLAIAVAVGQRHGSSTGQAPRGGLVPWFLWVFIALLALNSTGVVPDGVRTQLGEASRACIVVAVAALGMKTSFGQLRRAGWRPLAMAVTETVWLALVVLGYVLYLKHGTPA